MKKIIFKLQLLYYFIKTKYSYFTSRESLRKMQIKEFKAFSKEHLKKSIFYRSYINKPLEEWPIINKKIHMENFNIINTVNIDKKNAFDFLEKIEDSRDFSKKFQHYSLGLSSGTSGNRGIFVTSPQEQAYWSGAILAKCLRSLWKKEKIALFLRSNNNLYDSVHSKHIQFEFFDLLLPFDKLMKDVETYQPTILIAPAKVLGFLAKKQGSQFNINPKRIISIAEVLEPQEKEYIEEIFKKNVENIYQATEGFIAYTCTAGNMHLNEDMMIIEKHYLDDNKNRFSPIITDFRRRSQPIIRYHLDDVLIENTSPCPCGSLFTRLEKIEGRCDDILYFYQDNLSPVLVFPDYIRRAMMSAEEKILEYQVKQTQMDVLEISIFPFENAFFSKIEENIETLAFKLKAKKPKTIFHPLTESPIHQKRRRIIRGI